MRQMANKTYGIRKDRRTCIFQLNANESLATRKSLFDEEGKGGFLIERDAEAVAAARSLSFHWRKTVGSFQLAIPVSVKDDMLHHHMRLLSVFRWRLEHLDRTSRWYQTLSYYVDLLAEKVKGLGGNPYTVPITPDGDPVALGIARPAADPTGAGGDDGGRGARSARLRAGAHLDRTGLDLMCGAHRAA